MDINAQIARKILKQPKILQKRMEIAIRKDKEKQALRAQIEEDINKRIKQRMVEELEYQQVLTEQEQQDQKLARRMATLEVEKRMQEKQIESGSFHVYGTKTLRSQIISSIDDKIKRLKL
jgi:hypothetical protein